MRQTLLSFLDDCVACGDRTALVSWRGLRISQWSYARLATTAYQFARELAARRIVKGDRVLFFAQNSPEWVAAFYGCLLRGAVAVPLDKQSAPDFIRRVEQQVEAKLLLTDTDEPHGFDLQLPRLRLDDLSAAVASHSIAPFPAERLSRDDLVEIIFTSGTTAEPKGVCLAHRNFLASLNTLEREVAKYNRLKRLFQPIRFLSLLPLSHVFGQMIGIFVPQLLGGEVYFRQSLSPSEIINTVRRHRISVIATFPRLLETLRDKLGREYESRGEGETFREALAFTEGRHFLRRWWMFRKIHRRFGWKFWAFISGGATLNRNTEEFWRRLGYAVIQGYGMTETASIISLPHPFKMVPGSIGKSLPGQEVKLDEKGEILVHGEAIAAGYWTSKGGGSVNPIVGDEGWLHTGDLGEFDAKGNLFYRGRQKDVIATAAGMKVYPEDLEGVLDQQPEIHASCVVGSEGPRGPEPLAVLIPAHEDVDLEAAIRRANLSLAEHQQIRRWIIWPESDFPRTTTAQKTIRRLVSKAVVERMKAQAPKKENAKAMPHIPSYILKQIERISGITPTQSDTTAVLGSDLKLDSLGRVELLTALEDRYQVELDEASFTAATTLGELEEMIRESAPETRPYPYPEWPFRFPVTWLRQIVYYLLLLPITRLMCWVRIEGQENLRNLDGPVIFVANHLSMVDPALILSALPYSRRTKLAIAMRGELLREWRHPDRGTPWWKRPVWRLKHTLVVALFNVFPLPQRSGFRRSFEFAGKMVDHGYSLLIFPEGQMTKDGRMNPFLAGTGLLITKLDIPVIPIRIDGLFELIQQRRYFAQPGQVIVRLGEPLRYNRRESPSEITDHLEAQLAEL